MTGVSELQPLVSIIELRTLPHKSMIHHAQIQPTISTVRWSEQTALLWRLPVISALLAQLTPAHMGVR